jgi:hypothetical protein
MKERVHRRDRGMALLVLAALSLAACTPMTQGPSWGPNSPRNGGGEVVDPTTGITIPGYPQGSGV